MLFLIKKKVHIIENNGVIPNVIAMVMYFGNLHHRDQFVQNSFCCTFPVVSNFRYCFAISRCPFEFGISDYGIAGTHASQRQLSQRSRYKP